jgi:YbgC/YbaW family acyl-CoA thioester hydrolase
MSDASVVFRHRVVVRFRDCDQMGHVNHAVYFTYFEQCRLTWWRLLGPGPGIVGVPTNIVHADCDYRSPAFVHDELEVRLSLRAIGRSSVTLGYQIVNVANEQLLAEGTTVNVTLDPETRQTIRVPDATRALLTGTSV